MEVSHHAVIGDLRVVKEEPADSQGSRVEASTAAAPVHKPLRHALANHLLYTPRCGLRRDLKENLSQKFAIRGVGQDLHLVQSRVNLSRLRWCENWGLRLAPPRCDSVPCWGRRSVASTVARCLNFRVGSSPRLAPSRLRLLQLPLGAAAALHFFLPTAS